MRIAFFDSGFGGLSVLDTARRQQPSHQYLYYADSAHAPYGAKPAAQVRDLVFAACDFIAAQQPDALVVACNTATAVCIEALRARYAFPVIGMEPAVKPALHQQQNKRVLVLATSLTLQESKLSELLQRVDTHRRTDMLAMDALVSFAEQGQFDGTQVHAYLHDKLAHYQVNTYGAVVLGCTHFIYFAPLLRRVFAPTTSFVHGNAGTVRHLFSQLNIEPSVHEPSSAEPFTALSQPHVQLSNIEFYRSGVATPVAALMPYFDQLAQ